MKRLLEIALGGILLSILIFLYYGYVAWNEPRQMNKSLREHDARK